RDRARAGRRLGLPPRRQRGAAAGCGAASHRRDPARGDRRRGVRAGVGERAHRGSRRHPRRRARQRPRGSRERARAGRACGAERSVLMMERVRAERRRRLRSTHAHTSLLRMRWALADPDQWLARWLPRLRVCFSRPFLVTSVALFAVYALVAWTKWPELARALGALTRPASYTVGMFLVFWTTGMVVIAVHVLGHAFTCKYFGGQVHEMGAMLIYFQPAFYCNVNDAWTFRDRAARLWVTAAGSWIQLVVAGLAAIVWWAAVPETLISQIALAAMVIGGVTTVLANAN